MAANRSAFEATQANFFKWVFRTVLEIHIMESHFDPPLARMRMDGLLTQFDSEKPRLSREKFASMTRALDLIRLHLTTVSGLSFTGPDDERTIWQAAQDISLATGDAVWDRPSEDEE